METSVGEYFANAMNEWLIGVAVEFFDGTLSILRVSYFLQVNKQVVAADKWRSFACTKDARVNKIESISENGFVKLV